jgi:hypothetical protein
MREEYLKIPKRVLIDSDPMFTQIQYTSGQKFTSGKPGISEMIRAHNYHFSFGENIGQDDCLIPSEGLKWQSTRQPICLNYWSQIQLPEYDKASFTTLMNWTAGKKLLYNNEEWGQKNVEFFKLIQLPEYLPALSFSIVLNKTGGTTEVVPKEKIERSGWKILDPDSAAGDWISYQEFICQSTGELSVAKETYVKAKTGWFSCRSACYLAAGRPVVTQDTGWSKFIPVGNGLFDFTTMQEAIDALEIIMKNPEQHSASAREIAVEYFDSKKILNSLLEKIA